MMNHSTLEIQLLGDLQIRCNGGPPLQFKGDRQPSLLAYMVLHRATPQQRYALAAHFWPDSSDQQAMTNLRKVIGDLRKTVPALERYLLLDNGVITWQPDLHCAFDVADFELALTQAAQATDEVMATKALQHAVGLYRGDLLPHLYDDWVLAERERLQKGLISALAQLSNLYERQGRFADAISCQLRLLRLDPLHEETYRQLMRLHALDGDLNRVKRLFRECKEILAREFNAPPSAPTRALYEQLLAGETTVMPARQREHPPQLTPLVNRLAEWQQLELAWASAKQGTPQALLLLGEAGIGKSRLAQELFTQVLRQGSSAAYSHAQAGTHPTPYAPLIDWLRAPALAPIVRTLDKVWQKELVALLPELLIEQPTLHNHLSTAESWSAHRLQDALLRVLAATEKPLLLVLDDLQWVDKPTLDWLSQLLLHKTQRPLLVVLVARSEEIITNQHLLEWRLRLRQAQRLTELTLKPFTPENTADLAAALGGLPLSPGQAQALYQATEGHPLLIVEALRTAARTNQTADEAALFQPLRSPTIEATLALQLTQRSALAQKVAGLAAMVGRRFALSLLTKLWPTPSELIDALEELLQAGLICEEGDDYFAFTHQALHQLIQQRLIPIRQQLYQKLISEQATCPTGTNNDENFSTAKHAKGAKVHKGFFFA